MNSVKVGLIGMGTIGAGVAKILLGKVDMIERKIGRRIELVRVCDRDTTTDRGVALPPGMMTADSNEIMNDPEISIVVELIGGIGAARELVLTALDRGKNVVTANKALIANCGEELFEKARANGRTIGFEASVCGGVPVLASLQTSLLANNIQSIQAICNGTCNFILSQMESTNAPYADALKEAQRLGFAEADPTLDVDGSDSTQKLAILAQLAFGAKPDWKKIPRVGVDVVDAIDIRFAKELGRKIRLLAIAELTDEGLVLKVTPTLIPENSALAMVTNAFNAIQIVGDSVGPVFYQGWGAGQLPTASAVCSDVIDCALGRTKITFDSLKLWSVERRGAPILPVDKIRSRYYLRFNVEDRPGVLADVSAALGRRGVSIAAMLQHVKADPGDRLVPIIIVTYDASADALRDALAELEPIPYIGKPVCLAVRD